MPSYPSLNLTALLRASSEQIKLFTLLAMPWLMIFPFLDFFTRAHPSLLPPLGIADDWLRVNIRSLLSFQLSQPFRGRKQHQQPARKLYWPLGS
jgi:hypothetical protein